MRELEIIHRQLELVAVTLSGRVERIRDTIQALAFMVERAFENADWSDADLEAWVQQLGLVSHDNGFFERERFFSQFAADEDRLEEYGFAWRSTVQDPLTRRRLRALWNLRAYLRSIVSAIPYVSWSYVMLGHTRHACFMGKMADLTQIVPSDFDWHTYHAWTIAAPDANPSRGVAWTPPNIDYGGAGLISCVSLPVYDGDELQAVCSLDIRLKDLHADLALEPVGAVGARQTNFLFDLDGFVIAYPGIEPIEASSEKGSEHRVPLTSLGGDFATLDLAELARRDHGQLELRDAGGERLVFAFRVIPTLRWVVAAAFPAADMVDAINASFSRAFARLGSGDLSVRIDAHGNEAMQQIVASYNEMADALAETMRRREEAEAEQRRLALERERLTRELEIAATIQLAMLPRAPQHREFDFAGRMVPADEVGGDFYDVLTAAGDRDPLWITIGDVSGHGLGAGLLMMITQAAFEGVFETSPRMPPDEVLRHVNRLLHDNVSRRLGGHRYVTCQLFVHHGSGVFDCVGSHLWPLVIRPATGEIVERKIVGPWLGIVPDLPSVPVERVALEPGDVLMLYSDGIIEARNAAGDAFDITRLKEIASERLRRDASLDRCADAVLDEVRRFATGQDDDRTVLLIRRSASN